MTRIDPLASLHPSTSLDFASLLQIMASEQQIAQRTDQKAMTLLSAVGVILAFFFVHFARIPPGILMFTIVCCYLTASLYAITSLLLVIAPRLHHKNLGNEPQTLLKNPTFFGGIARFASAAEYEAQLRSLLSTPESVFHIFADSIYVLGKINAYKNRWVRQGMVAFILSVVFELILVSVVYFHITFS